MLLLFPATAVLVSVQRRCALKTTLQDFANEYGLRFEKRFMRWPRVTGNYHGHAIAVEVKHMHHGRKSVHCLDILLEANTPSSGFFELVAPQRYGVFSSSPTHIPSIKTSHTSLDKHFAIHSQPTDFSLRILSKHSHLTAQLLEIKDIARKEASHIKPTDISLIVKSGYVSYRQVNAWITRKRLGNILAVMLVFAEYSD